MKYDSKFALAALAMSALSLSACGSVSENGQMGSAPVTRGIGTTSSVAQFSATGEKPYKVVAVNVDVPRSLTTSEENTIKPRADLLWHEEPFGDRYAQVDKIMTEALTQGVAGTEGSQPVIMDVTVTRFHAQTERVRRVLGGEHELEFNYTLRTQDGRIVQDPAHVDATFRAYGGSRARQAMAEGRTQEVRIRAHLAQWAKEQFGGA
ncbi:MAG TPA: hypothetical protein DEO85_10555 [Maritimibacter sp.]|nr:hypothetical protein [Maritimibacter sp.]